MNFNVRKLELYITTKEQFNGYIPTLDDMLILSLSGYRGMDSDTIECCLIDSSTFKKLISYILNEQKHNIFNRYSVIPLNDEILKYIYVTLNRLKAGDKRKKNLERQVNTLKECIVKRKENEVICAFMY